MAVITAWSVAAADSSTEMLSSVGTDTSTRRFLFSNNGTSVVTGASSNSMGAVCSSCTSGMAGLLSSLSLCFLLSLSAIWLDILIPDINRYIFILKAVLNLLCLLFNTLTIKEASEKTR
ncbi:uncharacterized protein NEPG_00541 [Nematocida parisii ERTm1]|uniref:uncharacterized protein n=1 Tax=Nematocida parisii (strain ERTm1 / ATCC PRA-289) TaxID=881290 RepID=UPI000264BA78|nr:uncharacterized protein NEPG_00541 [Nematocida parisii ERTm1]EIJ95016.1 hypothetical protein NEPG_00541 [Nematocida parisii ERTm1]|eukprot:XP_013058372.1 hypothetical protein NEPG_00541 [Nematocida parisii ERTm1]